MSSDASPISLPARHRPGEDNREAPSALINGCRAQSGWLYLLSFFGLTLAGSSAWCIYQLGQAHRVLEKIYRMEPTWLPQFIDIYAAVCGSLALLNALLIFRAGSALRGLTGDHRVAVLHRALRRLRVVWRVLALSLVVVVAGMLVWRFSESFPSQ